MNNIKRNVILCFSCFYLLSFKVSAYSSKENCPKKITHSNNLQFSMAYQEDMAECWISINNMNNYIDLVYRSYLIATDGFLMVFNSYGNGPVSNYTGARHFYFFPREEFLNDVDIRNDFVSIRLSSKLRFQFDTKWLYLIKQPGFEVKTDSAVNRLNAGGVDIITYNGVFLDLGFAMGKSPSENPDGKSVFKNQFNQSCHVLNKQIFDYKNNDNYLHGDKVLQKTVHKLCPEFKWQD